MLLQYNLLMSKVELFPGGQNVPDLFCEPLQALVEREDLTDPANRTEFPQLYFDICPDKSIEGGFRIGTVEGLDLDGNKLTVKIVFHPKINDQVLSFIGEKDVRKIALMEKEPSVQIIPKDGSEPFGEKLDDKKIRNYFKKAMDVYYSTLS